MKKITKVKPLPASPLGPQARPPVPWQNLLVGLGLVVVLVVLETGCVQRRLTIRTDPPGAMAYVDGYPIGTTPISTDFIYYGAREIRLVKDGYETVVVKQRFWPPWYEIPPLDFVSENLVPGELRDHRTLEFRLQPQRITPPEQLVDRAERLRRGEILLPEATSPLSSPGGVLPGQAPPTAPRRLNPPGAAGAGNAGIRTPASAGTWQATPGNPATPTVPSQPDIGGRSVYPLPNGGF